MKFSEFIASDAVRAEVAASNEEDAIRELVHAVAGDGGFETDVEDEIVQAVLARENLGTTGLGHDAAIPHAKHPGIRRCAGTVGVSRQGIEFHSVDGKKVHLVFLVVSPPRLATEHVKALEWIAANLSNETFRRLLTSAPNAEEINDLLARADDRQFV